MHIASMAESHDLGLLTLKPASSLVYLLSAMGSRFPYLDTCTE